MRFWYTIADHRWPVRFRKFILDGIELKKKLDRGDYYQPFEERIILENRMIKHQDYILTFLYHPKVPPDNNGSERAIRNVTVKQKVSGQF